MLKLLKELCDANGVSGFEKEVGLVIADKIKDFCEKLYFDKTGNLIAFKKGKKTSKNKIMYAAHLDEVGMTVKYINDDGTLLFEQAGMMPEVFPSKRVYIGQNRIPGVICSKPVHLMKDEKSGVNVDSMYIDIGVNTKPEAEELGVFAQSIAFENNFCVFGDGNFVCSKALDDRFGCLVMMNMIMSELEHDSYFVFTVGEEIGGVGVVNATRFLQPDIAVVFETTTAADLPSNKGADKVCVPGNGAVVPFMDRGTMYDKQLYKNICRIAKENAVKVQTKTKIAGGTDAASIQQSAGGVRVGAVSLACRYIHTPSCVASVSDMNDCITLAKLIDKNLDLL